MPQTTTRREQIIDCLVQIICPRVEYDPKTKLNTVCTDPRVKELLIEFAENIIEEVKNIMDEAQS